MWTRELTRSTRAWSFWVSMFAGSTHNWPKPFYLWVPFLSFTWVPQNENFNKSCFKCNSSCWVRCYYYYLNPVRGNLDLCKLSHQQKVLGVETVRSKSCNPSAVHLLRTRHLHVRLKHHNLFLNHLSLAQYTPRLRELYAHDPKFIDSCYVLSPRVKPNKKENLNTKRAI